MVIKLISRIKTFKKNLLFLTKFQNLNTKLYNLLNMIAKETKIAIK